MSFRGIGLSPGCVQFARVQEALLKNYKQIAPHPESSPEDCLDAVGRLLVAARLEAEVIGHLVAGRYLFAK